MRILQVLWTAAVVLGFTAAIGRGAELFAPSRAGFVPASVRSAPGGYRSFVFWRGGK